MAWSGKTIYYGVSMLWNYTPITLAVTNRHSVTPSPPVTPSLRPPAINVWPTRSHQTTTVTVATTCLVLTYHWSSFTLLKPITHRPVRHPPKSCHPKPFHEQSSVSHHNHHINHSHQSLTSITHINHSHQSLTSIIHINHSHQSITSITHINHSH